MASKADKIKKTPGTNSVPSAKASEKKLSSKNRKEAEGENDDDDWDDEDDDEDVAEAVDDWEKVEEDEWDPDFEEFDVPKSKAKKAGKKGADEEDDFKVDEEFKDMDLFNEGGGY